MRVVPVLLLLAASPSSVSGGCTPRTEVPEAQDIARVELHSWSETRQAAHYWVTQLDVESGCVATETLNGKTTYVMRDCSIAELIHPRLAELIVVFELEQDPQRVSERIGEAGDGHGVVFERRDGSRWTADSKLLRLGAELLDRDAAEWMLIGPELSAPPPTPQGWMQLVLKDHEDMLERRLESDGRWSCETSEASDKQGEQRIVIRRGQIAPARAAELLDGFAGLEVGDPGASEWHATLLHVEPSTAIEFVGDALVGRWNEFAAEFDDDCRIAG